MDRASRCDGPPNISIDQGTICLVLYSTCSHIAAVIARTAVVPVSTEDEKPAQTNGIGIRTGGWAILPEGVIRLRHWKDAVVP